MSQEHRDNTATAAGMHKAQIEHVEISGFRSFGPVQKLDLPALTLLVGGNGAGKSNFLRFFDMLGWMLKTQKLQEFVLQQGGAPICFLQKKPVDRKFVPS